jgi:hypothetical protein
MAVGIAQLAEHRTVAPTVAGSIPVSHPRAPFHGLTIIGAETVDTATTPEGVTGVVAIPADMQQNLHF